MKNKITALCLVVGAVIALQAYRVDDQIEAQAKRESERKQLKAKSVREEKKMQAQQHSKKVKADTEYEKKQADLEYKQKAEEAKRQVEEDKARLSQIGSLDEGIKAHKVIATSDASWYK